MFDIKLESNRNTFQPGDPIRGQLSWNNISSSTEKFAIRLMWFTRGKGDRDIEIVEEHEVGLSSPNGKELFLFTAPTRPYSFNGKLISLSWAVEAVELPSKEGRRVEFSISSDGQEIQLEKSFDSKAKFYIGPSR